MQETLPAPKFRNGAELLLAGTLQTHTNADKAKTIPMQWGDFFALDVPEIHTSTVQYGVVTRADADTVDYMVAIAVPSFDGVNAPRRETLPAGHYAVFTIPGIARIGQHWMDIYTTWFPASGRTPRTAPAFERYDERYDPETQTGAVELWIPIEAN